MLRNILQQSQHMSERVHVPILILHGRYKVLGRKGVQIPQSSVSPVAPLRYPCPMQNIPVMKLHSAKSDATLVQWNVPCSLRGRLCVSKLAHHAVCRVPFDTLERQQQSNGITHIKMTIINKLYVHEVYKMTDVRKVYRFEFTPLGDPETWPAYEGPLLVTNPALRRTSKSRPKLTQYLNKMDSHDMSGP
ncbi:hypothetical protein Ahy_A09g044881 [Arachis hypogaea]|uniref:Uncharacterized protein n=1 Tax=Arachis hypogaea TaxID=3818 RepID=A0A445BL25_ARAHY|nr:hypothetical protein Ahy_A09g044881 [Arachis hypogaea]